MDMGIPVKKNPYSSKSTVKVNSVDYYWRGLITSPTVVSLKGRLPQKLQSRSTLSCNIVQIHSLFRHHFIKKPKSKLN